jgi:MFS family permease
MHKDMRFLLAARVFFLFGVSMQAILLGWRMYELTKDPLYLGFIGLAEAVPAIGFALFAGLIVDNSSPLKTYRGVLFFTLLSGVVMLITQHPKLNLTIHQQVIGLFCSSLLTGLARSFSQPSLYSMIPRLTNKETFARTNALLTGTLQISRVSGPALGGIIYSIWGMQVANSTICISLVLAIFCTLLMTSMPKIKNPNPKKESVSEKLLSGLKFVLNHKILFPAMTLDMVAVLFGGVTALLPIYAAEILHTGATGLGILRASPAIGAAIMSFVLTRLDVTAKAGRYLLWGVTGFGISILIFSLSTSILLSIIALAFSGAFDSVSMVVRGTAVQLLSPNEMRGRISSVNAIFIGSSNELGELESGIAARILGVVPSAVFGSLVCLLTVGLVTMFSPTLRRMNLKT